MKKIEKEKEKPPLTWTARRRAAPLWARSIPPRRTSPPRRSHVGKELATAPLAAPQESDLEKEKGEEKQSVMGEAASLARSGSSPGRRPSTGEAMLKLCHPLCCARSSSGGSGSSCQAAELSNKWKGKRRREGRGWGTERERERLREGKEINQVGVESTR